jgi:hypothetical protein
MLSQLQQQHQQQHLPLIAAIAAAVFHRHCRHKS